MNNLTRFDPFAEMRALQRQFFGDDLFAPLRQVNVPTTDVYTNGDKEMVVEAHLPNYDEKDIDVHVENGSLIIQAERREKDEDKDKKYVVRESSSSFYRSITLPERANDSDISADLHDGVLKVVVPFKELPAPKRVAINSESSQRKLDK